MPLPGREGGAGLIQSVDAGPPGCLTASHERGNRRSGTGHRQHGPVD